MGELIDPQDDPDFISTDGAIVSTSTQYAPFSSGLMGRPNPVFVPKRSTPLEEADDESVIPAYTLWSMKYLRHAHLFGRSELGIRECFGEGVNAVYVVDDGRKHCLISRMVGQGPDGVTYCLVAQISMASYEQLVDGTPPQAIFADAHAFSVCAVFEAKDAVSNVCVVESFDNSNELPADYLPPHPPIEFEDGPDS